MEIEEIKSIKINLSYLDVQGVERICDIFHERYETEISNPYFLILIREVTYSEFCQLVGIYAYFLSWGKLHIVSNPPMARTDILITAMKRD